MWAACCVKTTDSLSPNMMLGPMIGTPRYMSAVQCVSSFAIAVLAAVDLAPKVAVFTIFSVSLRTSQTGSCL